MKQFEQLKNHWLNFDWWKNTAIPYLYSHISRTFLNRFAFIYYFVKNIEFISVPDADWDNLILLDACRYDYFVEQNMFDADPEKKYSRAPQTPTFLQENFGSRDLHDTVVVSANPHQEIQLEDNQFHKVYHVWRTHWDEELRTVHPKSVTEVAEKANRDHPEKRLVIHYMQPHAPFIGSWSQENIGIQLGNKHAYILAQEGTHDCDTTNPYSMLEENKIDQEDVIRAYKENLNIVLGETNELLAELQGKTVISADHGEMFGERAWPIPRRAYQHPPIMAKKLLEIPWLVVEDGPRKTILSEPPVECDHSADETIVENRLQHLGYK